VAEAAFLAEELFPALDRRGIGLGAERLLLCTERRDKEER
jgi:hypothetical protein